MQRLEESEEVEYEEYPAEEDEPEEPRRRRRQQSGGHGIELDFDERGQPLVRRRRVGGLQSSRGWGNY